MGEIVRLIAKNAPIKAVAISATDMVERAREIHDTWPVATAALGRLLMGASMMGNMIKTEDGSVTLRINGGGMRVQDAVLYSSGGAPLCLYTEDGTWNDMNLVERCRIFSDAYYAFSFNDTTDRNGRV